MLRRATQFAPDDAHGWYLLGYCRYRLEDFAGARSSLETAFALDGDLEQRYPKQGGPAIFLARIAGRLHDAAAAERWIAQAARHGGNLDIVRHDHVLRELLGDRRLQLAGH
jgi:Flp pilus assembly protein TadD